MLKPAILYADQVRICMQNVWYDPRYQYYWGYNRENWDPENPDWFQFVSYSRDKRILGYIGFCVDRVSQTAHNLAIMSFDIGNLEFIRDVYRVVNDIFLTYGFNRLVIYGTVGNPALEAYKRLVAKHGGKLIGVEHECVMCLDGKLHDSMAFECMARDFIPFKLKREEGSE